jgi:hypothetical protein
LGALQSLYERFRDDVEFLVVYVREAHPEDGWVLQENRDDGIAIADPATEQERAAAANTCTARFALRLPLALDGTDDAVARAYGAWPDRLYLVGRDGHIAYRGGEGPFGFLPEELERAIERELAL